MKLAIAAVAAGSALIVCAPHAGAMTREDIGGALRYDVAAVTAQCEEDWSNLPCVFTVETSDGAVRIPLIMSSSAVAIGMDGLPFVKH